MNVFLWQELLRYSFGSYYELLSSKIMKELSFFLCLTWERLQVKCYLQFSKDVEKI